MANELMPGIQLASSGAGVHIVNDHPWTWQDAFNKSIAGAGAGMAYQAAGPVSYGMAKATPVGAEPGQIISSGGDFEGDGVQPQGDYTSLDNSGYDQAQWEFNRQVELLAEQRAFNSAEAEKNRQWQERMSNTAYQRAVEDLEKAGLNKWLAITGGNGASASTPSGSSATSSAGDASAPNPILYKQILSMIQSTTSSAMDILGKIVAAAI